MPSEESNPIDESIPATAHIEPTKGEIALDYLAQGLRVVPLGGYKERPPDYFIKRHGGDTAAAMVEWPKTARLKWGDYQYQEPTEVEVTHWWTQNPESNIGLLTGFEVYVVDADSPEAIEWCENNLPKTPWRVDTRRGRHYYYGVAPGSNIKNSTNAKAKIDIRGTGGYVVAAGSTHHTGFKYEWNMLEHPAADTYIDLPELTTEMVEMIKSHNGYGTSDTTARSSCIVDLSKVKALPGRKVKEGERNNEAARLAGSEYRQLNEIGIVGLDALVQVTETLNQWNEELETPLPIDEILLVAGSIQKTHERNNKKQESPIKADGTWPDPVPLIKPVPHVNFPVHALPTIIKEAVMEVQGYVQAPVALVVQSALTALSTASQAHYDVARDAVLNGPIGLFMLALGESGIRKTSCDGFFTQAIKDFEHSELKRLKPLMETFNSEYGAWMKKVQGIGARIKHESAKGECVEDLQKRSVELFAKQPQPPRMQRLIYKDATPEALLYNLSKWPSGVLTSSEGGSVFGAHGMNKDSAGNYLTKLNELWDGETLQVDRRQEGSSFKVQNPRFSLGIMVQPNVLQDFMEKAGHMARDNGFLARCWLTCNDGSVFGKRFYKEPRADMPMTHAFELLLTRVLSTSIDLESDFIERRLLRLSSEAKVIWVQHLDSVEHELRRGGEFENIKDVASKSAENAARLAALFEIATAKGYPAHEVSADSMHRAVEIACWYLNESIRFFTEVAIPQVLQDAKTIEKWLIGRVKDTGRNRVPRREIRQYGPNSLRDKDRIDEAIDELVSAYRIEQFKPNRTVFIKVNPALLTGDDT